MELPKQVELGERKRTIGKKGLGVLDFIPNICDLGISEVNAKNIR